MPEAAYNLCLIVGYLLLISSYAPQWMRILRTQRVDGLARSFLVMVVAGLAFIQVAALSGGLGPLFPWANAVALANAAATLAAYAWAVKKRKNHALSDGKSLGREAPLG